MHAPAGRAAGAPGVHRAPDRGAPPRGGGVAAPAQPAADRDRRPAVRRGPAGGDAAAAARGGHAADRAAAGGWDDARRRCSHGHDRVRRDAVPAVPAVYRAMDRLCAARPGQRPGCAAGARAPGGLAVGRRRPGRQPDGHRGGHQGGRAHPGRSRAARAGGRDQQDRPGADRDRRLPRRRRRNCCALAAASAAHPQLLAEITARSPQEPYRVTRCTRPSASPRRARETPTSATAGPAGFLADLRLVQSSLAAAATPQAYGELQHLVWQAETFVLDLAEPQIRQYSRVHAKALAELRGRSESVSGPAAGGRPR